MKNRSELREIIIKILYQTYMYQKSNIEKNINEVIEENIETENEFINDTIKGILEKEKEIIALANKNLKDWTIDRLSLVDKAIIILGIYELKYTDTPNIVCINEAIELSKKYSDEKIIKIINEVLDKIKDEEDFDE